MYSFELEHAIGYSCTEQPSLHIHPRTNEFVYASGSSVVSRDFDDPHQQSFLRGHDASLACLALSRRGTFVASGDVSSASDIVVWDYAERRPLWRFSEHDGGVRILSFSHDERLLLSIGREDRRMAIWDLKTGMLVASTDLPKGIGRVDCANWGGFAKDVKRRDTGNYQFATAGDVLTLWALDPFVGELVLQVADSRRNIRQHLCVAFAHVPDSCGREGYEDEWLLTGTASGDFMAFLVKPNKTSKFAAATATFAVSTSACGGGVVSLITDPVDETNVLIGGGDGTVARFVYQVSNSTWVDEEGASLRGAVHGLAYSATGTEMLAGSTMGDVVRARRGALSKPVRVCWNHCSAITSLSFAPGSNDEFATASSDGSIRVWHTEDYSVSMETTKSGTQHKQQLKQIQQIQTQQVPNAPADYATCLHFTIDAILSGWTDGCVRSHHAQTGELLWCIKDAHAGGVTALRLSNNMRYVVTGGENGEVRVWEMRMRQLVSHLKEHTRAVTRIVLFDDDVHAISCSRDKSFLCWDLREDKRISAHTQRMGGINDISMNHDQTVVITMGQERTISFWDLRESSPIATIATQQQGMHEDEATCIAISHGGDLFATGGMDKVVKLWAMVAGAPVLLQTHVGHTGEVSAISFTQDDRQLVSVGLDGAIFIWNVFRDDAGAGPESKK
ncbi:Guanine nucleotide-binding protein subunit beta-1 [Hondaea fermentalgiana]|uniref:Guanine nucleotide-binding protein subunit beta-1 n=1 Tax=Hondaea fermentalgiana TaxID=2315210 RepID=A0A2R5GDY5_9STRA|nr:Guanine nucleotide-binding protein subunit beta-1 [Hondaea fermentalgiana]|eukprot:GBG29146.1 Guanine nucleotide-binding protein subunit beta-1 [Hondaea fermentalgiana]